MDKIRKGDEIVVTAGKDKGKRGTILKRVDERRCLVEGVNVSKKHTKPNPMKNVPGGIVEKTMPIQISNIALYNVATGKADRVGFQTQKDGTKVRVFKSNGELVSTKA